MKLFWLVLVLASWSAWAEQPDLQLDDLNFNYKKPEGEGSIHQITYSGVTVSGSLIADISAGEEADHYVIESPGFRIPYVDQLGTFRKIVRGEMFRLEAYHGDNHLKLSFDHFYGAELRGSLLMKRFRLECHQGFFLAEMGWQDILEGCLKKGRLSMQRLSSISFDQHSLNDFALELVEEVNPQHQGKDSEISNLSIAIDGRALSFSMNLPAIVRGFKGNVEVKGSGQISLDRDKNEMVINVAKVKAFGFMNITSQFFDQLKGVGDKRVTVSQPFIRMKLAEESTQN